MRTAILETPADAWVPALDQDGSERENGEVVEIDTGLAKLPFKEFALNESWLQIVKIVMLAHDLLDLTQALLLSGELAKAEPKRLRYRLLHIAGRLAFSGRRSELHLPRTWHGPPTCSLRAPIKTLNANTG